uniref:Uncharacterized protein n=1 Tax=Arundo donax TaxID=35708 RepID=A0A0A9D7F1_ARUDO
MLDLANGFHFCGELPVTLASKMHQLLDGHNVAILELSLVNLAKSS